MKRKPNHLGMAAFLGLLLVTPPLPEEELLPAKKLLPLRGAVRNLAKLGNREHYEELRAILLELGDKEADHKKFEKSWEKDLKKPKPTARSRAQAAKKIQSQVRTLAKVLPEKTGEERIRLARILQKLDANNPDVNQVLGLHQVNGVWQSPGFTEQRKSQARIAKILEQGRDLEFELQHEKSSLKPVEGLYGDRALLVRSHGIEIHSGMDLPKQERILREVLRAAAISRALMGGKLEVPQLKKTHKVILTLEPDHFDILIDASHAKNQLLGELEKLRPQRSFRDRRGWRTSRLRTEADFQAFILWLIIRDWMGWDCQPTLLAGQLNWLSLYFFGTTMPTINVRKEAKSVVPKTTVVKVDKEENLWWASRRSLFGCRSWMKNRVREGKNFPWSETMQDQLGKIRYEGLLKTTLVFEYLLQKGMYNSLLEATRKKEDRVASFEKALPQSLAAFEKDWEGWLLEESVPPGLVQKLGAPVRAVFRKEAEAALKELGRIRDEVSKPLGYSFQPVALDEELCAGAEAHAAYLEINKDQWSAWPDAHEEYADREGFSPAGARSGLRSVIHFIPDPVESLKGWMGTFYHRLPLLHPGLFGMGYGQNEVVTVLDCTSLVVPYVADLWIVWPPEDSKNIPLRFQPELPHPVPGEDQSTWGYPVTLQAFWEKHPGEYQIEMSLFEGKGTEGKEIDCHYLTPTTPKFKKLAPADSFCLIPKEHLKPGTVYTVRAVCELPEESKVWSFTTGR